MELAKNKKAYFDYEILNTYTAGIVLHGYEVKAVRSKRVNLKGGHVSLQSGEAWLENVDINPYQAKNQPEESGKRKRKLLLSKHEIAKLDHQSQTPGLTIIPLKVFLKNNRVKIEIGIGRGKKKYDKREAIKKRDTEKRLRHTRLH